MIVFSFDELHQLDQKHKMFLRHICARLKSTLVLFISIFKRALCCFSRKRRDSFSECEMLSSVNVVSESTTRRRSETERDWNSWDDSPRTVDEHIEQYRQKLALQNSPPPAETKEPDFFQDMAPKIIKQQKVLLQSESDIPTNFSRLQATTANIPAIGADLEDWTDDDQPSVAWEELNDEHTKHIIREKRKELRAQKQQQKQKASSSSMKNQPILLAERIDSRRS